MDDVDEIRNLLGRYCHHLDAGGETTELAGLFTEDGEFELLGETYTGRAAIAELFAMFEAQSPRGLHVTLNTVIEVSGQQARAHSDWLFVQFTEESGTWSLFAGGRYLDHLVRTGEGWRFRRRSDVLRGNASMAELTG